MFDISKIDLFKNLSVWPAIYVKTKSKSSPKRPGRNHTKGFEGHWNLMRGSKERGFEKIQAEEERPQL